MELDLQKAKSQLKKMELKEKKFPLYNEKKELSIQEYETMRNQFFASGIQKWYENYSYLTFSSCFIDLTKEASMQIISEHSFYLENRFFSPQMFGKGTPLSLLAVKISERIKQNSWKKVFIKHSTRSPKDSPIIVDKAMLDLEKFLDFATLNFEKK